MLRGRKKRKCQRCGIWFAPFESNNGHSGYSHYCKGCIRNRENIKKVI